MRFEVDGKPYDWDHDTLMLSEAREIKRVTDMTVVEWEQGLNDFDAEAVAALVWLARLRDGEANLKFTDVEFNIASFKILDDDEAEPDPTDGGGTTTTPETTG